MSLPLALGFVVAAVLPAQSATNGAGCPNSAAPATVDRAAPGTRISVDWHVSARVVVPGSKPPVLRDAVDLGLAPGSTRLDRMLLLLEPSAAQSQSLDAELEAQQSAGSCEYHHWLSAAQFADRYANSAGDVNAVADWLRTEGFALAPLPVSRGWIEFSGTAAQVTAAFGAPVRSYSTATERRFVLGSAISVPSALSAVVQGLVSLDGSKPAAAITPPRPMGASAESLAGETELGHAEALTPRLAAQVLHFDGIPQGWGESIAVASRSNIRADDIAAFRSTFGLPANPIRVVTAGTDPGLTADQAAAELAASWAGVAAPGASIIVAPAGSTAATDGVDLALAAIVDQNLAHTVVVGYSACEAALSESHRAYYAALYRQAAAQGMSTIAATGDSGAAACEAAGVDVPVRTGFAVNALATTPWNTAVGAAVFATSGTRDFAAWSPVHTADPGYATGGGHSASLRAPAWQSGLAGPSATRVIPDLSLPTGLDAAAGRGLAFCFSGSESAAGCRLVRSGGSAAAAAIFAGVSAALAQQNGGQGNLTPRLYALRGQPWIFTDIEQGSARLACSQGTTGCDASGTLGYDAGAGFDAASGLGVPDASGLVKAWPNVGTATSSVTLTVSPTQANTTYNPSANVTLTATIVATSGVGNPTGTMDFADSATGSNLNTTPVAVDTNGKASITVTGMMPHGGNTIVAKYSGDATYAAANSQALTVNIQPSSTITTVQPSTTTPAIGAAFPVKVTVAVNTPPAGTASPTGKITLNLDGLPYASADATTTGGTTSVSFSVTIDSGGSHNLQAIYAGDGNYVASTAATVSVTISKGATVTTLAATPAVLSPGVTETFTATIAAANGSSGTNNFTGTITFFDGTSQLGTANVSSGTATLGNVSLSTTATHVITAVYSGDDSWATSTSNAVTMKAVLIPTTIALTVSPSTAAPGQVVTMTAIVTPESAPISTVEQNPTGSVVFYNGTTIIATAALTPSANNTATAQLLFATLPAGTATLSAVYVGDAVYGSSTSNTITITVQDFVLTPGPGNPPADLDIIKGTSGQFSFIVSGVGGFNGPIAITCAVPATNYMTCVPNVTAITPTGTVTFTVNTFLTGSVTAQRRSPSSLWPRAVSGTALAAMLFFLLPAGRRARIFSESVRRVLMLVLLLGAMGAAGTGCSSVSGSGSAGDGTPLGQTTLKITAGANVDNTVFSHSAYISVNVLPPGSTGTAQPVLTAR